MIRLTSEQVKIIRDGLRAGADVPTTTDDHRRIALAMATLSECVYEDERDASCTPS